MRKINLRQFYPFYRQDIWMEVSDSVAAALIEAKRAEDAQRLRIYRNRAYYSLDAGDGIERDALVAELSIFDMYENKLAEEWLYLAFADLPETQRRRVHAHYCLGISKTAIARAEGVSKTSICDSINRGLERIKIFLQNFAKED